MFCIYKSFFPIHIIAITSHLLIPPFPCRPLSNTVWHCKTFKCISQSFKQAVNPRNMSEDNYGVEHQRHKEQWFPSGDVAHNPWKIETRVDEKRHGNIKGLWSHTVVQFCRAWEVNLNFFLHLIWIKRY